MCFKYIDSAWALQGISHAVKLTAAHPEMKRFGRSVTCPRRFTPLMCGTWPVSLLLFLSDWQDSMV